MMTERTSLFLWCCVFAHFSSGNSIEDIPTGPPIPIIARERKSNDTLLFVQVVWRHGDRAPTMTYPTDIHQEDAWPNGWGELTQIGMRQQYALGQLLHNRYINTAEPFISRRYNSKQVYIRSTDVNRTLVSAYANIAGMFTDGEPGKDYPELEGWPSGWTPVPVHTLPVWDDHVGNVFAPCPRAQQLDDLLRNSDEFRAIERSNERFLQFLSEKTGMKVDLQNLYLINDVHYIETIYNMTQPDWLTLEVSQRLRNLTLLVNEYTYGISKPYLPELIRLRGGSMLRSVVDLMNQKIGCHQSAEDRSGCEWIRPLRYYAYSAHDTTVAALLATFGDEQEVIRGGFPQYTASVAVELWMLEEGPAVRILFHGAFHHDYHTITHLTKGCPENKEFCPLEMFERRSQKFMPVNIKKECQQRSRNNKTYQTGEYRKVKWRQAAEVVDYTLLAA